MCVCVRARVCVCGCVRVCVCVCVCRERERPGWQLGERGGSIRTLCASGAQDGSAANGARACLIITGKE